MFPIAKRKSLKVEDRWKDSYEFKGKIYVLYIVYL